ncbi:protein translocase subunit SecF [Acetivibrio straminisolvens]|jgi:preprotein translocase subunit SecF|uniref:Protein-export membrane protein SecF n=1 Tax=Acetivibrio straminisolvens JCM 21531 TaxID=1294263 RepID=W4V8N0_9FIRM|nr:protein translocase subunit SecF [Acetivibrio straminisolvens]GAE89109.1 protein-export membrane protein SecF [Acetivibrio straminisolvens JCM 21531]
MFDYVGKRKYFFILSSVLLLIGLVALIARQGLNLDVQFRGGTQIEIQMENGDFDANRAENIAKEAIGKSSIHAQKSQTFDTTHDNETISFLVIKSSGKLTDDERNKVLTALKSELNVKEYGEMIVRDVDPSIGAELLTKGLLAVALSMVLLILYIGIRFNIMSGLVAGFTAVVAVLHDVLMMVAVYAVFNIPVNESFIAAVLTVLGYSVNDTIVIYDRIRENSKASRKESISTLVNSSIAQSMSRTINTTVTTLICVITVFAFAAYNGISSMKEFTFPLIIGLISGTYSSIFIATPLWELLKEKQAERKAAAPAKA